MRQRRPPSEAAPPSSPARARVAALGLVSRRDYSAAELRARLTDRGYTTEDVDDALTALAEDGTIDDRRVASQHVRIASQLKGRGRLRIQRELEARGISSEVADEALAEISVDDDAAAIERFLSRQRLPERLSMDDRNRLFRRLLRKGFDTDAIGKALRARAKG